MYGFALAVAWTLNIGHIPESYVFSEEDKGESSDEQHHILNVTAV